MVLWFGSVCLCGCCAWSNTTCDPGVSDLTRSFSPRWQTHTSTPVFSFKRKGQSTMPVQMIFIVIFDGDPFLSSLTRSHSFGAVCRTWISWAMIKALMMSFYEKCNHKPYVDCKATEYTEHLCFRKSVLSF